MTDNGLPQNTGADKLTGKRVSLPDIELMADNTTYTVTLTEGEGYTIAACEGSENPVKKGSSFSFNVTVADGYEGTPVVKAGETELIAVEGVYTIENIQADQTVTVEGITKIVTYTVTLTEGEGYTISACEGSENPVKQGGSFSFTVTVADGYEGTPVVKAGETELVAVDGIYTIENINADQTVTVSGIEKAAPVQGNLNGDAAIDAADAALVYSIANGNRELTEEQLAAADVNGDGKVNAADAALIYAYANGKISSFPGR
jgi:phage protein U